MTDTTDLAAPAAPATAGDIDVEIWGPPGSGKTVLLASLYETFDHLRELDAFTMSRELQDVHRQLLEDQSTPITRPSAERRAVGGLQGEQMSVTLHPAGDGENRSVPGRRVRIVSHAGEDLRTGATIDAAAWAAGRDGKVVIACLNPFLLDAEFAWKGLRHLIAVLQGPSIGYPLQQAVTEAVYALLHVDADAVLRRSKLRNLLPYFQQTTLTYDASQPDPDLRFDWGQTDPMLRQQLTDELRRFIHEQVRLAAPLVNVVRRGLRQLDHVVVVLTHVDLVDALLPSITFADFERVFHDVFAGRPHRMANQQVLARLFHIEVSMPFDAPPGYGDGNGNGETATGPRPRAKGAITGRLRTDGAVGVVNYIKSVVALGGPGEGGAVVALGRLARERDAATADARRASAEAEARARQAAEAELAREQIRTALSATEARLREADQRAADATAEVDRERQARQQSEATAGRLQVERDQLAEKARAQDGNPDRTGRDLRDLLARRDGENRALREEQARLQQVIDALQLDSGRTGGAVKALEDRLAAAQKELAERATVGGPDNPAAELRSELDAARRRFEELRSRTHDEIARRDESIQSLGEQVRTRDLQVAEERNLRKTAEKGGLSETEAREREGYEAGRAGPARLWAALLARSLPAVPACAVVAAAIVRATSTTMTFGHAFVIASVVGVVVLAASLLTGVYLYWGEVGPRWVWFRSRNDKAGLFDVLTSTGERVQSPPREFTLEVSPILELLGLGVVRRGANGLTYATTEPDAWRAHLEKTQVRRRWLTDAVTVVLLLTWAVALVALAA
jgi:hypothetical protein